MDFFSLTQQQTKVGHPEHLQHTSSLWQAGQPTLSPLARFSKQTDMPAELMHIRNSLPDEVVVQRIDERLSALGNCIACNDYVALIHPDLDKVGASHLGLSLHRPGPWPSRVALDLYILHSTSGKPDCCLICHAIQYSIQQHMCPTTWLSSPLSIATAAAACAA